MNKLTRLTINKFRNVAPTTLEFRPGINVLLGKNAAGKTTLLRLLSTIAGKQDEALTDEPFEVSHATASGPLNIAQETTRTRIEEPPPSLSPIRTAKEGFPSFQQTDNIIFEKNGTIVLKAEVLPNEVSLTYGDQHRHSIKQFQASPILSVALALWRDGDDEAAQDLGTSVISSQIKPPGRMDESLELFNSILEIEIQIRDQGSTWTGQWLPRSLQALTSKPVPEGTTATFSPAFLARTARVLGYESASARFDIERPSQTPNQQTVRLSNLRFFFKRASEEISHDLLSYGQKRLLSFFAYSDSSPDIIIADELVNGLHHEWIAACIDEIGDRQAFLTSQNPLLLDFLRFDSAEEVRHTFIICERAGTAADAQLIWRNLTEDEAESFFLAYQTGIQRVSDILLTKGLW
ncbi:hypothetical protein D7V80_35480 [Corallococcus sp. CA054B]|uniref:AAA family ATPase n=1 Tax=Corallococcus sp. CA054B TaxID=2316734 RepID=UPI000EA39A11|nr:AAA family ATPase [Corallococcus sp. CA054B]RKG60315.1 hypothetical protein D7V80_35480 [Corallococcus sp. CA054B]